MNAMRTEFARTAKNSIYEMNYGSERQIRDLLERHFEAGHQVIHMPDYESVMTAQEFLRVEVDKLLIAYRMLKANDHSDVIDAANGCGGVMDKYVNITGAEYRCRACSRTVVTAD